MQTTLWALPAALDHWFPYVKPTMVIAVQLLSHVHASLGFTWTAQPPEYGLGLSNSCLEVFGNIRAIESYSPLIVTW